VGSVAARVLPSPVSAKRPPNNTMPPKSFEWWVMALVNGGGVVGQGSGVVGTDR